MEAVLFGRLNYRSRPWRMSHGGAIRFRQFEGELAADPGLALHQDPAAVGPGNLLHHVETDPEADQVGGLLGFDPGESLEELAVVLRIDAEAVIQHADPPARFRVRQADVDPPRRAGAEPDGIVKQLTNREVEPIAVS